MIRAVFIFALSALWSGVNAAARWVKGPPLRLPVRVLSVGNIQAGGAGKTPLVAWIARQGASRGLSVCILCRGYRGKWEKSRAGGVIAPRGQTAIQSKQDVTFSGDEAALLHELAPEAWIGVGRERATQFERVLALARKIDLVVIDDGFQNLRILKDTEIVALTSSRRWERVFRDFDSALARAHLLVWTKGERAPSLGRASGARTPLIEARFRVRRPPGISPDAQVALITGVGDAKAVRRSIEEAGVSVQIHWEYPDHHFYEIRDVTARFEAARLKGCKIALTGKDWMKWKALGVSPRDVLVFEPEVDMRDEDLKTWNEIVWPG